MNLRQRANLLLLLVPVLLLANDGKSSGQKWHIKGSLSDACSCAVPCTCMFGRGPSPHDYCYDMDSYKIEQGNFNDIQLDGLKFGIAHQSTAARSIWIRTRARCSAWLSCRLPIKYCG